MRDSNTLEDLERQSARGKPAESGSLCGQCSEPGERPQRLHALILHPRTCRRDFCTISELLTVLEHGRLHFLTEEVPEVKVSGHQLLLHVLQGPLVLDDLQRLPLALR